MRIYCIIPARGGSKRIKNKNLVKVKGKPLLEYSIDASLRSKKITQTYVSSDSEKILNFCKKFEVNTIKRNKNISSDTSTTEETVKDFLIKLKKNNDVPDYIVLLQPTSPFKDKYDIDKGITYLLDNKLDSLFSGCINKNLFWKIDDKKLKPLNYNYKKRKMEQSFKGQIMENGNFYVFNSKKFKNNRLFGKIGCYLMNKRNSIQIDDIEDLKIANKI